MSGEGANADGRAMWARVKGRTENELPALDRPVFVCGDEINRLA